MPVINQPKRISDIIKYGSLLAIIFTAIAISLSNSYLEFINFSERSEQLESDYIASQKALIKQEVTKVTDYIKHKRVDNKKKVAERIKSRVYEANAVAANIYKQFTGQLPEKKIEYLIIEALRPLRFFGGDGHYSIYSSDGVSQLQPLGIDREGSSRFDFQDPNGHSIVKEMWTLARDSGEGFLVYDDPGLKNKPQKKTMVAFVKYFKPLDWLIITKNSLANIEKELQEEILHYIEHIQFGKNSYIFVVDYQGTVMMNASQKHLIGKNIWDLEDPNGVKVIQEERKAVENPEGDFIHYYWNKPSTSMPSPKTSFMKGVKDWQWMIGAGIYLDDAQQIIAEKKILLKQDLIEKVILAFFISLIISMIIISVLNVFSKRFDSEINQFIDFFKSNAIIAQLMDVSSLRYTELRELAKSANKMLDSQNQAEQERARAENALRKSETSLKEAQKITHFGSWELDLKTNKLDWSDEVYRIFELDPKETIPSYKTFIDVIHPDDRVFVDEAYKSSIKNKTIYDIEHRLKSQEGKIKRVREHAETYYDDNGYPLRSSGTIQDITELREKEEQLKRAQKMDALGKLTGGIAHDYNNMLGVILGYSEILKAQIVDNPKALGFVLQIQTAGERARDLTSKLLTFSRSKSSESVVVNINDELQKQREMIEKTLTPRIQLTLNLENDVWPAMLDTGDLHDSIINMAINASHAIEANGTLSISTCNKRLNSTEAHLLGLKKGDYIELVIADSGAGMDSRTIAQIFDPFFSTKGDKGTGLGLSQVYGFVERSGGIINVYSQLGQGTRFELYFPRCHGCVANERQVEHNESEAVSGNESILVVDDEPGMRDLTSEILNQQGYKVFCAENGPQALKILETKAIDLMLSDVIMPKMNGYQLAARVYEKFPGVKVQLASGFNDERHKDMIDVNLTNNLLHKPFAPKLLLKKIRELLDDDLTTHAP